MAVMHKKGILFTLISVLISMLFIFIFLPQPELDESNQMVAVRTRVDSSSTHVRVFDDFIFNSVQIAGRNSFNALTGYLRYPLSDLEYSSYFWANYVFWDPDTYHAIYEPDEANLVCDYSTILMEGVLHKAILSTDMGFQPALAMGKAFYAQEETTPQLVALTPEQHYFQEFHMDNDEVVSFVSLQIGRNNPARDVTLAIYEKGCDRPLYTITSTTQQVGIVNPGTGITTVPFYLDNAVLLKEGKSYYLMLYAYADSGNFDLVRANPALSSNLDNHIYQATWEESSAIDKGYRYGSPPYHYAFDHFNELVDYDHTLDTFTKNISLNAQLQNISSFSRGELKLDTSYTIQDITLTHSDPWTVDIGMDVYYVVNDSYSSWNVDNHITVPVDIIGLMDPQRCIHSSLCYSPADVADLSVKKSDDYSGIWDLRASQSLMGDMASNGYYISSTRSPTFLMRFTNDNNVSPYGIESFQSSDGLHNFADGFEFPAYTDNEEYSDIDFLLYSRRHFVCEDGEMVRYGNIYKIDFETAIYYNVTNWVEPLGCYPLAKCGNGIAEINEGEQCDGLDLNGAVCNDFVGRDGGDEDLYCTPDCQYDISQCPVEPAGCAPYCVPEDFAGGGTI